MSTPSRGELPSIQATMDLIQWFVPLLNRLPRDHRFGLGDRLVQGLYDLLEGLVAARYATAKLERLEHLNARLDLLRLQIRLLHNFQLIDSAVAFVPATTVCSAFAGACGIAIGLSPSVGSAKRGLAPRP